MIVPALSREVSPKQDEVGTTSNPGGEGVTWEAYLALPLRTSAREKTEGSVSEN
jgi:hypothetical protein